VIDENREDYLFAADREVPVSALDVSVRAQILNILLDLQWKRQIAPLFISHDLAVVERMADRIAVMYAGRIVEDGDASALMTSPLHPYTQALLSSVPVVDRRQRRARIRLTGEPSSPMQVMAGCAFAPRCPEVREICRQVAPALDVKSAGHRAACHLR
jgi:oligopeptide/dipeptide ABC transporter ATP-binding protein